MSLIFSPPTSRASKTWPPRSWPGARARSGRPSSASWCASPDLKGASAVAMVGVKSKRLFDLTRAAGAVPIMLDKGYIRTRRPDSRVWEYWRVSVGAPPPDQHHPDERKRPHDRLEGMGLLMRPWRSRGYPVVIAGSSAKYHAFYGMDEPNVYYRRLVDQLRKLTDRNIIYRPKPSYREAEPIPPAQFSTGDEDIEQALQGAWALVTHGSNACFEAAVLGIPSIMLGRRDRGPDQFAIAQGDRNPMTGKREQWLANLAYHQWTEAEMRSGEAWKTIGGQIDEFRAKQRA
jgi:hypothetical protein